MTPIFSRSWFVKMQIVSVRLSVPASLRSACDISRACRPTWESPISPSISAFGVSAATESIATTDERARADQELGDLERLLAGVGLRDEQLVDVDADPLRVGRVHRVLGVDEGADAAAALGLGDHVVDEGRLARRLGAEDLDDAAARQAADAEREVERQRAGRDRADRDVRLVAHLHHGALAEVPLDLPEGDVQSLLAIHLINLLTTCQPMRLARPIPGLRTPPRRDAAVRCKQPRRTERPLRARAAAVAAAGARGTAAP